MSNSGINLDQDVTMNQFLDFFSSKIIPEINKWEGWKAYLAKGIRGENENSFGIIYVIESEDARNKYYNEDGSMNELGISFQKEIQPIFDELNKLGTWNTKYTDWIVL